MSVFQKKWRLFLSVFFLFPVSLLYAQKTANQILYSLYQKSTKIRDYSVDANIKVDLPFIKMLPVDARLFFKQEDKFRVKSKGIAILPKQGFTDFSKAVKDTNSYNAFVSGMDVINKMSVDIINIIPNADTSDLVLGKLWVNTAKNLLLKSQLTTKSNGTILMEYVYNSQVVYGLPDSLIFTVDVKKFKVPKGITTDINNTSHDTKDTKTPRKGKIFITLKNYKINNGLSDSVFSD